MLNNLAKVSLNYVYQIFTHLFEYLETQDVVKTDLDHIIKKKSMYTLVTRVIFFSLISLVGHKNKLGGVHVLRLCCANLSI